MYKFAIAIFLFLSTFAKGQDVESKIHVDSLRHFRIKPVNWDTLKYRKYDYVFIVGIFNQYRDFKNEIEQKINSDTMNLSKHTYVAESSITSGLVLNYDKFQLAFGTRTKPREDRLGKGYTNMFNIGLSFGDNRWVSENYYRHFKGFYNANRNVLDSTDLAQGKYMLAPHMVSSLFMTRLMYFTNYENFSFKSGFGCNYRQLKSEFTWIVGANYSKYSMFNDSSLIPASARYLFNEYAPMRGLRSNNIGVTLGAAATIVVFKAWFINGHLTFGPEQQWRDYDFISYHRRISYIGGSGTFRVSLGLNLRKFYFLVSNTTDYNRYNSPGVVNFKSQSITHNWTLGWRFHSGTPPRFYRKFMTTRFYRLFA